MNAEQQKQRVFDITLSRTLRTEMIVQVKAANRKEAEKIADDLTSEDWDTIGREFDVMNEEDVEDTTDIENIEDVTVEDA